MLKLNDVTLLAIDTFRPERTQLAMAHSMRWVQFAAAKLLTNRTSLPQKSPGIELVMHRQDDKTMARFPGTSKPNTLGYEMSILRDLHKHFDTSHALLIEWDAAVMNHRAWEPSWLNYDLIGAAWPPHHDEGWPPCDGVTNAVGNGGFSLRSKRFCELTAEATEVFKGDPAMRSSDRWVSRTIRPWLEDRGMKFAPVEVAERFSCENRIYCSEFGYHGRLTAAMNGWGGPFASVRP